MTPLQPGQYIYAIDGCFDPLLVGPSQPVRVGPPPSGAPLLSPAMIAALLAILGFVGIRGLRRRRSRGSVVRLS